MAIKDSFKGLMGNVKARSLVIAVSALIIIGLFIVVLNMKKKEQITDASGQPAVSSVGKINPSIKYVPGGTAPPEYYDAQYQDNLQRAEQADQKGVSAIPTIVADQLVAASNVPSLDKKQNQTDPAVEYQKRLLEQQKQQLTAQQQQASQEAENRQQAYEALMAKQAEALFASWHSPQQVYVSGSAAAQAASTTAAGASGAAGNTAVTSTPIYKAGDILYAILETSINTDEPGPILAKIVSGPLKDARIIGNLTLAGEYAQKVMLQFSVINIPNMPNSVPFSAVGIDPDTARTALASNVDNHYLLRYGTLFASAFMEGMSQAVLSSINNPGFETDGNGVIVGSSVTPTVRDQIISGFGQVGQQLSEKSNLFNRPATITVDSGTAMGLLMLQDFSMTATPATAGANAATKPSVNAVNKNQFAPAPLPNQQAANGQQAGQTPLTTQVIGNNPNNLGYR